MISKNLLGRLEQLEESLLPVLDEPMVLHIIGVDGDGRREDTGIKLQVQQVPMPLEERP